MSTYASQIVTFGGSPQIADTFTIVVNGVSSTYTAITGDTVLSALAGHAATKWHTDLPFITASPSGAVVTLTSVLVGNLGNYSLTVSKVASTGSFVAGGANFSGGQTIFTALPGYLVIDDQPDQESDTTVAPYGSIFVHVEPTAGTSGEITVGPIIASTLSSLSTGTCSIVIEQP